MSDNFIDFNLDQLENDPAVNALISSGDQAAADSHLSRNQRKKVKRERNRAKARLEKRINLELPVDLKQRLISLAEKESIPISQIAAFVLWEGILNLENDVSVLIPYKRPSRCPKFDFTLDLDKRRDYLLWNSKW
jgi:hypothetical protein